MGFMNWLMKGIGFESEGDVSEGQEALAEEKRRARELKKQEKLKRKLEKQRAKNGYYEASRMEQHEEPIVTASKPQISETTFAHEDTAQPYADGYSSQAGGYSSYDAPAYGQTSMNGYGNRNIVFFNPRSYAEVKQLIDYLKQGESVMLNLDGVADEEAQRMLDFASGAVYAINGNIKRVNGNIFLLTTEGLAIVAN